MVKDLRVLWELEAGRRILDSAALPDLARWQFDDHATFGAFLDALRWGAVTNAETTVLQAPAFPGTGVIGIRQPGLADNRLTVARNRCRYPWRYRRRISVRVQGISGQRRETAAA